MAIKDIYTNEITHVGCVVKKDVSKYWLDGMTSVYAIVWDVEEKTFKNVEYEYIGAPGYYQCDADVDVDVTDDIMNDIRKTLKAEAEDAWIAYAEAEVKKPIVGEDAVVVRGRKIPKGTRLNVFWMGDRETYMSSRRSYHKEYETICGCYDEDGNKIWIKAEYLNPINGRTFSNGEKAEWIQEEITRRFDRGCRV